VALASAALGFAFTSASCGNTKGQRPDAGTVDEVDTGAGAGGDGGSTGSGGSPVVADAGPAQSDADQGQPDSSGGGQGGGSGDAGVDRRPVENVGPLCSSDGWCWENPLPQGNTLNAVFSFADDDVWAVGVHGTIMHWNGKGWTNQYSVDPQITLTGLWGSGPDDIWAVGTKAGNLVLNPAQSVILHWDGSGWYPTAHPPSQTFTEVAGSAPDNVWAVGASAPVRWDGSAWRQTPTCPFCATNIVATGAWTNGPNDTWVVGPSNLIAHWNGSTWAPPAGDWDGVWMATWASGANDVWIVGFQGVIAHYNGVKLEVLANGGTDLMSIWGSSPTDVWAVGMTGLVVHFDGFSWSPVAGIAGPDLYRVRGRSSSAVWAVGRAGRMLAWDGTQWSPKSKGSSAEVAAVSGSGPSDVWIAGSGDVGLQHRDASGAFVPVLGGPADIVALYSVGANKVWAIGDSAAIWNGDGWNDMPGSTDLTSVWAAADNDAWAGGFDTLGEPELRHWDGQTWTVADQLHPGGQLTWIAGSGPQDVWAVTTSGGIFHYDGSIWTQFDSGSFSALWGVMTDAGQAWAVGEDGAVLRVSNGTVTRENAPFTDRLESIYRVGPNDYWVAGKNGIIGHYDGTSWTASDSGTDLWLMDVWASGPNDVWAVGFDGAVLHKSH
jgi:hypothetical protein